ncbi:EAL domain-containing protein [Cereibacter azotoformans]|uniref:Diguanylate cyclase/phosphodiesterase with PAS/PAC sensor(S) n=1 Tax=Cereibacter sphaeroides (strain ATCC 17025 / ATH 2.4.3) TaxID=349102 RepID=A4WUL0_CERS5|nr:EAL domain-containing protein [Cereibacter azotoformans]ULB10285.1 EAL domain-containing protein [Cereibacter azotoformans]
MTEMPNLRSRLTGQPQGPAEECWVALFDGVAHPVLIKNSESRVIFMNSAACELLGCQRGELEGRAEHELVGGLTAAWLHDLDAEAMLSGSLTVEQVVPGPAGLRRFLVSRKPAGEHLVVTFFEITELRRTEEALREREAHLRGLLDLNPLVPFSISPDGTLSDISDRLVDLTGLPRDTSHVDDWWAAMHPDDRPELRAAWAQAVRDGGSFDAEHRLRMPDGQYRWFRARVVARRDEEGRIDRWFGILEDVHERHLSLDHLRESEARFRAFADDAPVMIWVTDVEGHNVFVSRSWLKVTGQSPEEAVNEGWAAVIHPEDRDAVVAIWESALRRRVPFTNEFRVRRQDGSWCWVIDVGQPRVLADGTFIGYIGCCVDISARRQAEDDRVMAQLQVFHMARHDMLTGLPNRHYFGDCYEEAVAALAGGRSVAVHMLDLDGFKAVNDTRGHPVGDQVLRQVADRLRTSVRSTDTVARLGGDEFAVIQTPVRTEQEACDLARRLIAAVSKPFNIDGTVPEVGASVGIAFARGRGDSAEEVMRFADVALYAAKQAGRGTFRVFDEATDIHLQSRQKMKSALRAALGQGELSVFYQPLIGLADGRVTACEALMRWHRKGAGWITPDQFIPVAEEAGLIGVMGEWVLHEACAHAARWPDNVSLAVNLSPLQFHGGGLVDVVVSALRASGLPPERLQLEITESVLLDPTDRNITVLQELRAVGVKIVMDDFGTGYSSLGYLRSFPFDKIKVDRSFIRDLPHAREALAILKAVAGLGRSLDMRTTVEGVETQAQLDCAIAEGVDEAQGFFFSRPLPAPAITSFISGRLGRRFAASKGSEGAA